MSSGRVLIAGSFLVAGCMMIVGGLTMADRVGRAEKGLGGAGWVRGSTISIRAGTVLRGELQQTLRSDQVAAGQEFWLKIKEPLVVRGELAIPLGSRVRGEVIEVERSTTLHGAAHITLAFRELDTESGSYPIKAQPLSRKVDFTIKGKEARFAREETIQVRLIEPVVIRNNT